MSLSICFSTKKVNTSYIEHIKRNVGNNIDYEILFEENNGEFPLTKMYNDFLKKSKYNIVLIVHDDLIFSKNFGKKILNSFNVSDYGILGLAGTTDIGQKGVWWEKKHLMVGTVHHQKIIKNKITTYPSKYSPKHKEISQVQVVDGLFLAINKSKIKKEFDTTFKGFHFYDLSFCIPNYTNGVKIGVVHNIDIIHKSVGATNLQWEENRKLFISQYDNIPPLNSIPSIQNIEVNVTKYKIDIIIPHKNNNQLIFDCLDSIVKISKYPKDNIIVHIADTGSTIKNKEQLKEFLVSLPLKTILYEYDFYNFAKINNLVSKECLGDLILFCNNDIELKNDAISKMVETYHINKKNVGTIGARLIFPNNTIQHGGISLYKNKSKFHLTHTGLNSYYGASTKTEIVLGNTAAFLLMNRRTFNLIGKFNEETIECFEDVILNIKLLTLNKINIYSGESVCIHKESSTRKLSNKLIENTNKDYFNILLPILHKNELKISKYINKTYIHGKL